MSNLKRNFLSVFFAFVFIFSIAAPSITAAAAGGDLDIGALICDVMHSKDWKVSGKKINRGNDGYVRISGKNTVAGYSRKLSDEAVKLRFRCTLDSKEGWVAFMLRSDSPRRELWTAKRAYGLLIRGSSVELQKWRANTSTSLALVNFAVPEDESLTLRFSACNKDGATVLTAIINGEDVINFTDTADPITERGYFSIMTYNDSYVDIYADSNQAGAGTPPLVYLTGCYEESGKRFIHWRYNGSYPSFSGVAISGEDGSKIAELSYPIDRYDLPASYTAGKIYITPITENGVQRERIEVSTVPQKPGEAEGGRIAVQSADEGAYFYDTKTGEPFIPRGANYIRLRGGDHSTFEADTKEGAADYDGYDAEAALKLMADSGMNTVRVFVVGSRANPGIAGDSGTNGLYAPYMDNLADFISRAKRYGIYVILAFGDGELPRTDRYTSMLSGLPSGRNICYLTDQGMKARSAYLCDVLNYLKGRDPGLLGGLLAVELQNELFLYAGEWPFGEADRSAKVTGADGRTYDMSADADRQALADNGIRIYLDFMTDEIKKIDPALLVCEGSFTYYDVGASREISYGMRKGGEDTRLPFTANVLLTTKLDFLDIHFYHNNPSLTPAESFKARYDSILLSDLSNEAKASRSSKPIIVGEFGSLRSTDNSKKKAIEAMQGLREAALGSGMRGMLYWTLDCFEQKDFLNLCEYPEMLSDLAKFDVPLPKVDISALHTPAPVIETTSVPAETAAPADDSSGAIPVWIFVAAGAVLAAGIAALGAAISKMRKKKHAER